MNRIMVLLCVFSVCFGAIMADEKSQVEKNLQATIDTQNEMLYNKDIQIEEMTKIISGQEKRLIEAYDRIESLEMFEEEKAKLNVRVTHYSADETGTSMTASGKVAEVGRTVACNFLPLGTRVKINGNEYVVEDTGNMIGNVVDIYVSNAEECERLGTYHTTMEVL